MSNIDKHAVQAVADLKAGYTLGHADVAILNELARIALASLEVEPVAYMYKDNLHADARFSLHTRFGNWSQEDINEYEITEIPLYTAPPAPVSDSLLSELLGIAKRAAYEADECAHAKFSDDSMEHSAAIADWERRAAMLQGAELVTTANKLPEPIKDNRLNSGEEADDYYSGYQAGWNECLETVQVIYEGNPDAK
ncbi:hypothetical protein [Enterobacter hormaechei]|uniref:hypothetical protein n=1 Tax=Enterobacter hormaechei TaxID=158836 RepID=UPI0015EB83B5|nr:hypothetical protein [Enterobacter hormaechei]MBA2805121.1 hypothetical protein [Enterobacter hormaechei]MCC2884494.1 hypothetical protein [Enterobacter hormaechei]MCC2889453.1 hypothetical protein [Enterobacter hormaechei]QMI67948.1 hypothetical protein H1D56_12070 [Enterobacter hormaechei]QMI68874.1 hypothetical protein H1Z82_13170 [Enterobacter hormaechei]